MPSGTGGVSRAVWPVPRAAGTRRTRARGTPPAESMQILGMRQSLWLGARASGGFFVSTFLFGLLFGAAAVSAGIGQWHALLMSTAVFSASAQFAALEFWLAPLPLVTIALSVALVSARNILLGMAMTYHLDGYSLSRRLLCLAVLTDPGVVSTLRLERRADKLAYLTGYGLALLVSWLLSTAIGLVLAGRFGDLDMGALAFAGPLVMATMMMLMVRGTFRQLPSWLLSGLVAILLLESGAPDWSILLVSVFVGALVTWFREYVNARSR